MILNARLWCTLCILWTVSLVPSFAKLLYVQKCVWGWRGYLPLLCRTVAGLNSLGVLRDTVITSYNMSGAARYTDLATGTEYYECDSRVSRGIRGPRSVIVRCREI